MKQLKKIVFLVSGSGTNMENLIKRMQAGEIPAKPVLVVSNRPGVKALERASNLRVPSCTIDHKEFAMREAFDRELAKVLDAAEPDIICLAGFMRILSPWFVSRYERKLVNIHPSYLPAFPGGNAIKDAFLAKVKETGVTIHYVDHGMDSGEIIMQVKVPVLKGDTLETLEARVHAAEYELYPRALNKILADS